MSVSPIGNEVLVNTAVAGTQSEPRMAALSGGGFVVVWTDGDGNSDFTTGSLGVGGATGDTSDTAVKAQVLDADGHKVGNEILVNTAVIGPQAFGRVTALEGGRFAVVWQDGGASNSRPGSLGVGGAGGDTEKGAIKAQVFEANGAKVGGEILVNSATAGEQDNPQIVALEGGGFVAVWDDASLGVGGAGGDTDGLAVKAQLFDADGQKVGSEILVNTATAAYQGNGVVAGNPGAGGQVVALAGGGFAISWNDGTSNSSQPGSLGVGGTTGDTTGSAVKAQVFNATGGKVGSELLVNTATASNQVSPQLTALENGFVAVWRDQSLGVGGAGGDTSSSAVKGQVFAVDGTRVGGEFLVNTATTGGQLIPQITMLHDGGFVVTWQDNSAGVGGAPGDASGSAVKAQVFDADGSRRGGEILVNTLTAGAQAAGQVIATDDGFVVVWQTTGTDVDATGFTTAVKGQAFTADGLRLGSEFLVNSATESNQNGPRIVDLGDGKFAVAWTDFSNGVGGATGDTEFGAIKAQVFGSVPGLFSDGNDGANFNNLAGSQKQAIIDLLDPNGIYGSLGGDDILLLPSVAHANEAIGPGHTLGWDFSKTFDAGEGSDFVVGADGNDHISGGIGRDTTIGGSGNDTLDGGAGADFMLGGDGNDIYFVDDTFDLVDEGAVFAAYGSGGADTVISSANWFWDTYSVGEKLQLTANADQGNLGSTIVGSMFSNEMTGNAGNNWLFGRGGSDTYVAGDGIDMISLSTLGLNDQNAYAGVDGTNTIVVTERQAGPYSYDVVFAFDVAKDLIDVSRFAGAHDYTSIAQVKTKAFDDGFGNCYFALGDGLDYLYLVGVQTADLGDGNFIV